MDYQNEDRNLRQRGNVGKTSVSGLMFRSTLLTIRDTFVRIVL